MKLIQILLLLIICLTGCKVQEPIIIKANFEDGKVPGGCYFSIMKDTGIKKEVPFILEIVPAKYEMTEVEYSDAELEKYSIGEGWYQFRTKKAGLAFIMNMSDDLLMYTIVEKPVGYMYCMLQSSPEFVTLTKEDFNKRNNTIRLRKVVSESKIIKRYVRKKPRKLKENQYFFEGGYWTEVKRAVAGSH